MSLTVGFDILNFWASTLSYILFFYPLRCILASLYSDLFVRRSVGPSWIIQSCNHSINHEDALLALWPLLYTLQSLKSFNVSASLPDDPLTSFIKIILMISLQYIFGKMKTNDIKSQNESNDNRISSANVMSLNVCSLPRLLARWLIIWLITFYVSSYYFLRWENI